ncbi:hypothetical protein [Asticcacaulis sp. MM231]|uniref:hypothetical protein n=1 Tax=Asticcacaulis sp. MM231 TaxID=3157666 RepID=UPI0032D59B7E
MFLKIAKEKLEKFSCISSYYGIAAKQFAFNRAFAGELFLFKALNHEKARQSGGKIATICPHAEITITLRKAPSLAKRGARSIMPMPYKNKRELHETDRRCDSEPVYLVSGHGRNAAKAG